MGRMSFLAKREHISFAAILDDVGKIGVSEELLTKSARLTGRELDDMQAHPEIGARILEPVHFMKPIIAAIRHHHENYDGSGYPPVRYKRRRYPLKGQDRYNSRRLGCQDLRSFPPQVALSSLASFRKNPFTSPDYTLIRCRNRLKEQPFPSNVQRFIVSNFMQK